MGQAPQVPGFTSTMSARDALKRQLRRHGFDLRRYTVQTSGEAQLQRILAFLGVDLVFDIGANAGQYATALRAHGYLGRIVSFEPLASAHAALALESARDPLWQVAPRLAIGEREGEVVLNVAGNSLSSSLLPMLPAHERAAETSRYAATESVRLARLDRIGREYLPGINRPFLKIDTQGYEDRVLAGATGILASFVGIEVELSLVPLYEGQLLYDVMIDRLRGLGFELFGVFPGYVAETTGRTLQFDGVFVRRDLVVA